MESFRKTFTELVLGTFQSTKDSTGNPQREKVNLCVTHSVEFLFIK